MRFIAYIQNFILKFLNNSIRKNFYELHTIHKKSKKKYSLYGFHQKKIIYIHIPKCGGISINKALYNNYGGMHRTASDYLFAFNYYKFNTFFKFTVVRNPYTRLFSAFNFLKKGGFNKNEAAWVNKNLSDYKDFEQFILGGGLKEEKIINYYHFRKQVDFLKLPKPYKIDNIYKIENLEALKKDLAAIGSYPNLRKLNQTFYDTEIRTILNKEIQNIIYEFYKEDFLYFDYSKSLKGIYEY